MWRDIYKLKFNDCDKHESDPEIIHPVKMRVAFICGSLEIGCDGVGDYTRILATEMIKQQHDIVAIALNDPYVSDVTFETQYKNSIALQVLRIPSLLSEGKRFSTAQQWIEKINPGLISLQFVIYAYHKKGLAFGLGDRILKLCDGRYVHIMFHELYIGFTKISPLRHKITGYFQRKIILSLLRSLRPKLITTTNGLYQSILAKDQIASHILNLFSNIPVSQKRDAFISKVLDELRINEPDINQFLITGIFGNVYPENHLEKEIFKQLHLAHANGKKLVVLGFGKINNVGETEFESLKTRFTGEATFLHLGEQPEENVSSLIQILDTAFSCTPEPHIGKSGVFAAFRLHGVKVIVPEGRSIPEYKADIPKYTQEYLNRPHSNWSVNYVAEQFSYLLKDISS